MKNYIYLLLFIQSFFCFAQEPPAIFKLKYSLLETDSLNVTSLYKINSPSLKYYKESKNTYLTDEYWNKYKDEIKIDKEFLYLYMGNPYPRRNDIIILNVFKKGKSKMTIFVKINFNLDYGEKLYLKGINFVEGNYFIDLSSLKKESNDLNDYDKKEIDLSNIKDYKISQKKLNQKIQL